MSFFLILLEASGHIDRIWAGHRTTILAENCYSVQLSGRNPQTMCFQVADEQTEIRWKYLSNKAEEVQVMPLFRVTHDHVISLSEKQSDFLARENKTVK